MKLLLDGHVSKATVTALHRLRPGLDVVHLADWLAGAFRMAEDEEILAACAEEGRSLVSYDQCTIPELLRRWAAEERRHAGVIFGDDNSVPPNVPGRVARALVRLMEENSGTEMTNAVLYLRLGTA